MNDHLRVGDAERDHAAALLRAQFAAGRLTPDEFDDRLSAALGAVTFAELDRILDDLPGVTIWPQESRLERSYRRLLALYPARYRRVHEDEMLAVLMTAAPEGKVRPGLREAADLIAGGIRVWCQPSRRLGRRGVLVQMGAGAAAGLLGGITVAAASPRTLTSDAVVLLPTPASPAAPHHHQAAYVRVTPHRQLAIARSQPVLAHAAEGLNPAMSVQALRRDVHLTLLTNSVLQISAQAATAVQAQAVANAVAMAYSGYASKNVPRADRPMLLDPATIVPQPSLAADILDSSGLGALCGALLGAIGAIAVSRPRRRFRMT